MCSFRQVDERHISAEVTLMEWSPTMDLIALATIGGEVFLHRLSWQKVWTLPSPGGKEKEVSVNTMSWRPDGKVLAVGYSTGVTDLCDVERANILHTINISHPVTAVTWVSRKEDGIDDYEFYTDKSSVFLPKLPSLNKAYGSMKQGDHDSCEDGKRLKEQKNLNFLVIGTDNGYLSIFCFGIFPAGEPLVVLTCPETGAAIQPKIISVALSMDLSLLTAIVESSSGSGKVRYHQVSYEIPLLLRKHKELQIVAQKYTEVSSLLTYLSTSIKAISEAWEDILLEIDSKLMHYAEEKFRVSSGTVSDDFLELLMFGTPSDTLEKFLLHDLTEKGLKKLGHSIELSYSNIQKLVLKHLQCVTQALFYQLSDLKGLASWEERFGDIGLSHDAVAAAVSSVGSFLLKATEIQQVIDNSMKNFKAFFRWLYSVILRLSDEPIPPEITKVTQQDLNFVAEFLKDNFATEWNQEKKSTFSLERVGQYLKMEDLPFLPPTSNNPWMNFLVTHPQFVETGIIFPHYPNKSLAQQHKDLQDAIHSAFEGPSLVLAKSLRKRGERLLFDSDSPVPIRTSHFTGEQSSHIYTAFLTQTAGSQMFLLREGLREASDLQAIKVQFERLCGGPFADEALSTSGGDHLNILDLHFYSEEVASVLLSNTDHNATPILVQMPLKTIFSKCPNIHLSGNSPLVDSNLQHFNGSALLDKMNFRRLDNMRAAFMGVSGSRKVACVLFSSRRRVRIFEMDVEDEEEELDETDESFSRDNDSGDTNVLSETIKENSF